MKTSLQNLRFLLALSQAALFSLSCSEGRKDFDIPEAIPVYQLIIDKNSELGPRDPDVSLHEFLRKGKERIRKADASKSQNSVSPDLGCGLMVPVTADGYCLTAAHSIDEGLFFTLVELNGQTPLFLDGSRNEDGTIDASNDRDGTPNLLKINATEPGSGLVKKSKAMSRQIQAIRGPLSSSDFQIVQSEFEELAIVALIPTEVIKVWKVDDLALIKVPFPTPSYISMATEEVAIGEPIMLFGNPLVHEEALNHVAERLSDNVNTKLSSDFYLIFTRDRGFTRKGDSGGPVINRSGKLVGIHRSSGQDEDGFEFHLTVGLRADVVMDAIREAESHPSDG